MALELAFSKGDLSSNWGFRLVGGSDFDQPLVVVKVNENSLAEESGLQVGDVIVRVNNISTAGLTHTEVHDIIKSSGLQFTLGVRRGDSPINIIHDEDYNFEFQEILRGVQQSVDEDIIDHATNIVERLNRENSRRNQENDSINGNIRKEKMVFSNTAQTDFMQEETSAEKKWSTFLVKPNKPIPQPKRTIEEIQMKNDPYKVVIKKRSFRRKSFGSEKKVQFDQNITELEPEAQSVEAEDNAEINNGHEENAEENNVDENTSEDEEENYEEVDNKDENENVYDNEGYTDYEYHHEPVEIRYKPLSEIKVDDSECSMTLEEQLLAVQKQLQALSQLPSAIQMTLDAVSKQLASIVSAKESSQDREAEQRENDEEDKEGSISVADEAEAEVTQAADGDTNSNVDEELDDDSIGEEEIKAILDRARMEEGDAEEEETEEVVGNGLTEEEREALMKQEQLETKKEKGMEELQTPPKPIQRPIILPGGRKWSNPEDAMPRFRKPKMSEEKIIETIENNLEPIVGKRKGESNCWMVPSKAIATKKINFLKYQPPPKNLDYLQRSEVYRLVHDMEPPVRGIVSRPEKVLPEQDYYEATKGAP